MTTANREMEERYVDLGYVKQYADSLSEHLFAGDIVCRRTSILIKEAHTKMQEAYASAVSSDGLR